MLKKKANRRFHSAKRRNLTRLFVFGALSLGLLIFILSGGLSALANLAFFVSRSSSPQTTPTPVPVFLPPPILSPLPSATNSAQIKLTGFSQKETTIEIFLNEKSQGEIETDDQGQFTQTINLEEDENEIYAVAQNFLGNYSPQSERTRIIFDDEPPELKIEKPADGEKFYQERNRVIEIKGQTETEAQLYLNDHLLVLDSEGKFSTQFKLSEEGNILRFLAKDAASNQTERKLTVFYQP